MTWKQLKYRVKHKVADNFLVKWTYRLWPQKCRWLDEPHEGKIKWRWMFSGQLEFPVCEKHYADHLKIMEQMKNNNCGLEIKDIAG